MTTWTEARCPACLKLGWDSPRLLFRAEGTIEANGFREEFKCHRCKSVIGWIVGSPNFFVVEYGEKNPKRKRMENE